jgi:hypothetical protein
MSQWVFGQRDSSPDESTRHAELLGQQEARDRKLLGHVNIRDNVKFHGWGRTTCPACGELVERGRRCRKCGADLASPRSAIRARDVRRPW